MAFKNSWQQQRQHRLQQVEQRRQAVSLLLQEIQKQRQEKSSQLRSDLSLFREMLSHDTRVRREKLQHDRKTLHQQTQEFLAIAHAERESVSQQLNDDLHTFRLTLTETVNSLRQETQADLQQLQLETRSQLQQVRSDLFQTVWEDVEKASPAKPMLKKSESRSLGFKVVVPVKSAPAAKTDQDKIYEYVEVMQSVRLTEIESALSMTRIQAVEGLRSLIQQGKITQRDRLYSLSSPIK